VIFKTKKNFIKHQYTIVELLVVLVIAGLLTGLTMNGIKGALARQGATGAVRTLALKVSLAQSFAVSKNRYVALIVPDYDQVNMSPSEGYSISSNTNTASWNNKYSSCFVKNRLCYVTKNPLNGDYEFDRWVDGYEWQALPSKTVAFITEQSSGDTSTPIQVKDVPDPTDPNTPPATVTSTALVFKPSGALVNASQVVIRIFRAEYVPYKEPGITEKTFYWQGTEDENKGWKIVINGFTGRSRFCLGGESIED
jgi:type II secretory pathway pseudopilin PulG